MSTFGFQSQKQNEKYYEYKDMGYEYVLTEPTGAIHMVRMERGYDYTRELDKAVVETDGAINKP